MSLISGIIPGGIWGLYVLLIHVMQAPYMMALVLTLGHSDILSRKNFVVVVGFMKECRAAFLICFKLGVE